MTISTNARPSDLRPKIMRELYGNQIVYLLRKGNILHLLFGISDWMETEFQFGPTVASFSPFERRWFVEHGDHRLNHRELLALIGDGEVCMGGKDCPKHKEA